MKFFVGIVLVLFISGCTGKPGKEDLATLNGYWEIEKVALPDGTVKHYQVNTTVDQLTLEGMKGLRRKAHPQTDGSFETANDAENFIILEENDTFKMRYTNRFTTWTEVIRKISRDRFSVVNKEHITCYYKRYEPINIDR